MAPSQAQQQGLPPQYAQAQQLLQYAQAQQLLGRQLRAVAEQPVAERIPFDLVNLATAYVDALGEVDHAGAKYERLKSLGEAKVVSQDEADDAKFRLKTAQRKVELLYSLAARAIEATQVEVAALDDQLKMLRALFAAGGDADTKLRVVTVEIQHARARSRLEMLKSIAALR